MRRVTTALVAAVALASLLAACGGDDDRDLARDSARRTTTTSSSSSTTSTTAASTTTTVAGTAPPATARPTTPATPAPASISSVRAKLTKVAQLNEPLAMVAAGGDVIYFAEQSGAVRVMRGGRLDARPVVDLSSEVSTGYEQGLLGVAVSRDGRLLYLDYTDRSGDTHIVEYTLATGARRELLFVDQPFPNHNGGQLVLRPDGTLWIALGDGGSGGDPQGNAQNLGRLLGKILRIRPVAESGRPYGIPADNPFVNRQGARGEIWDYGLRNPWRFSFDRATGDLWIGDVGQNAREEVDFEPPGRGGRNYGWNAMEGNQPYKGSPPPGAVPPLFDYATANGNCAVIGGFVYRGSRIPGLAGTYLYGDNCKGDLLGARQQGGRLAERGSLKLNVPQLTSFGEDASGELYVLSRAGGVFRLDPA